MRSMTGFGSHRAQTSHVAVEVSVRAVNGRFLEPRLHLPREFIPFEGEIRKALSEKMKRGTVDVFIQRREREGASRTKLQVNRELAKKYVQAYRSLAKDLRLREDLRDVVIGVVVEAARHPDSDHLWVTKVDAGTGELLDVVCGAPNVTVGRKYPFAPAGSTLPGGLKLERRKIRGAISNGMLCSARELALGEEHDGILELDTAAAPGTPFLAAVPVGDVRFVVDVTPNRPDLLSHLGLAREIAAATGTTVRIPPVSGSTGTLVPAVTAAPRSARAGPTAACRTRKTWRGS